MIQIPIELLDPNPFQPRRSDDPAALEELASDIQRNGLIHPPVVRAVNGRYQIVCGHRRVEACRRLGWETITADVRELSEQDAALIAWSENESRQALNPLDRALAIRRMMEVFGWTQEEAGKHLGLARSTVANILRLLDLRPEVQEALRAGRISERQALALAPLSELQWDRTDGWVHKRVQELLDGKRRMSSDEIRDLMRAAREEASRPLSAAIFDRDGCAECRSGRQGNRCFNIECFDKKTKEAGEKALLSAQEETGIPRWESTEEPLEMFPSSVRVALERQCPNLRLIPSRWIDAQPKHACVLGRECQCVQEAERRFQEEIQRKNEARRALVQDLVDKLLEAMAGIDDRVLRTIFVVLLPGFAPPKVGLASEIAMRLAQALVSTRHQSEVDKVVQEWIGTGEAQ